MQEGPQLLRECPVFSNFSLDNTKSASSKRNALGKSQLRLAKSSAETGLVHSTSALQSQIVTGLLNRLTSKASIAIL